MSFQVQQHPSFVRKHPYNQPVSYDTRLGGISTIKNWSSSTYSGGSTYFTRESAPANERNFNHKQACRPRIQHRESQSLFSPISRIDSRLNGDTRLLGDAQQSNDTSFPSDTRLSNRAWLPSNGLQWRKDDYLPKDNKMTLPCNNVQRNDAFLPKDTEMTTDTRLPNYWEIVGADKQEATGDRSTPLIENGSLDPCNGPGLTQLNVNVRRGKACKPEKNPRLKCLGFQKVEKTETPVRRIGKREKTKKVEMKREKEIKENSSLFDALDLCHANTEGSLLYLRALLQNADSNILDSGGRTLLYRAVGHVNQNSAIVKILLDTPNIDVNKRSGANEETALYHAVGECMDVSVVKMLLAHPQIDVNITSGLTTETPLMRASRNNHREVVKLLLDRVETRLDKLDEEGDTAEDIARKNCHHDIVQLFAESILGNAIDDRLKNIILKRQLLALKSQEVQVGQMFDFFESLSEKEKEKVISNKKLRNKCRLGLREENILLEKQILAVRRKNIAEKVAGDVLIGPDDIWT